MLLLELGGPNPYSLLRTVKTFPLSKYQALNPCSIIRTWRTFPLPRHQMPNLLETYKPFPLSKHQVCDPYVPLRTWRTFPLTRHQIPDEDSLLETWKIFLYPSIKHSIHIVFSELGELFLCQASHRAPDQYSLLRTYNLTLILVSST